MRRLLLTLTLSLSFALCNGMKYNTFTQHRHTTLQNIATYKKRIKEIDKEVAMLLELRIAQLKLEQLELKLKKNEEKTNNNESQSDS